LRPVSLAASSFRELPPTLRDRPTLVMKLDNGLAGPQELELSYLTAGLSWKADYVGELAADDSHLDLTGWVTLNNTSGTAYRDAQLQLVAGDVNRVRDLPSPAMQKEGMRMMAAAAPMMEEEALFEYHLYSLARPTSDRRQPVKAGGPAGGAGHSGAKGADLQGQ
jgi:hypothetical protein